LDNGEALGQVGLLDRTVDKVHVFLNNDRGIWFAQFVLGAYLATLPFFRGRRRRSLLFHARICCIFCAGSVVL